MRIIPRNSHDPKFFDTQAYLNYSINEKISIGFLGTSCEDVIVLDLNTAEERLSIDARIKMNPENTDPQVIALSLTGGFYDENIQWVTDAEVEILEVDNNIIHPFLHDAVNPGHYILDFTPIFEVNYKLIILYNGETYESSVLSNFPFLTPMPLRDGC